MLKRISIQNFALIDSLELTLGNGLQVITGETGAGKSILLGALRLILGERADLKSSMNADKKSIVEAEFEISSQLKPFFEANDLDFDSHTIVRRELLSASKSRAFVNDRPVTLDVLKMLSSQLIDIHSQFETASLFTQEFQFNLIDGLAGNSGTLESYQSKYEGAKTLEKELKRLESQYKELTQSADYRTYLLTELEDLPLDELDWAEVQTKLQTQQNVGIIVENLQSFFSRFDAEELGVLDSMLDARAKLSKVADLSHEFTALRERLESNFVELKDILFELQNKAEDLESSPELLAALQIQVDKINALFVKHGVDSLEGLREVRDKLSGEQTGFHELESFIETTKTELSKSQQELSTLAKKLSVQRLKYTDAFSKQISQTLSKLGLEKARMEFNISEAESFGSFGKDHIQLLFQANSGFDLKPIHLAISGGERSRVMLAIKKIMAQSRELPTLILDEIDTGVSGKVAEDMGILMKEMSSDLQLILITHLAQVAAKGQDHYKVVKSEIEGKTTSTILKLDDSQKLSEVAQLLSGSKITDAALAQAKELMK
ncbi:DNA repair protein RecN [Chryseobacterium sp. A321]